MKMLLLLLLLLPGVVSAHELQIDGTIGAILHIDPDDQPVANQVTTFHLDFQDTAEKLDIAKCNCVARFSESGRQIAEVPFTSGSFVYTFTEGGSHTIEVSGTPKDGAVFQAFRLSYDIQVKRPATPNLLPAIFGGFAGLVIVVISIAVWRSKKRE